MNYFTDRGTFEVLLYCKKMSRKPPRGPPAYVSWSEFKKADHLMATLSIILLVVALTQKFYASVTF